MPSSQVRFPRTRSLCFGLTVPFIALKLILSKPKLIFWSLLPILITLSLYGIFITQIQSQAQIALHHSLSGWGLDPGGWIAKILLWLTKLLLLLLSALTFSFVAGIAACPFNDFLAEQSEAYMTPPLAPVPRRSIIGKVKLILLDLFKAILATAVNLAAILLSWIPFVGFLAFGATFLLFSFQYISYPQTRRGLGISAGVVFLWKHLYACLGFGAIVTFLFTIPIISSFSLPLAVVGGTLLVARCNREELSQKV